MMNKYLKWTFIAILIAALGYGATLIFKNRAKFSEIKNNLPKIAELGKVNEGGTLFGPKSPDRAADLNTDKIIEWTNKYRQDNGIVPLAKNGVLEKAAKAKTDDMFAKQYFEHNSPSGVTPGDLVMATGYNYRVTGENLALGDFTDEKDLVDAWMASPGHRANILNAEYTEIGVNSDLSSFKDRGITWISVQEFGKPAPKCKSPDKELIQDIEDKKTQYETLVNQTNELNNEANELINKGNEIYKKTRDMNQAKTYWDQGTDKRNQAKQLEAQLNNLYGEIQSEINQYNVQVNNYNSCIQ